MFTQVQGSRLPLADLPGCRYAWPTAIASGVRRKPKAVNRCVSARPGPWYCGCQLPSSLGCRVVGVRAEEKSANV